MAVPRYFTPSPPFAFAGEEAAAALDRLAARFDTPGEGGDDE